MADHHIQHWIREDHESRRTRRTTPSPAIKPIGPSIAYITLTKGFYALIDAEDSAFLSQWNWIEDRGYATRPITREDGKQRILLMHRVIMGLRAGEICDHKNRNGLDLRRSNLRIATRQQNMWNTSPRHNSQGFPGIHLCRPGKWKAIIKMNGKNRYLGIFNTPEAASQAYLAASAKLRGEFHPNI
jgi:hypothetical protein